MLPSYICPEVYGPWLFESGRLTKREGWISSLFPFTLFSMHRLCFTGSKLVGLVCNWDFRFVLGSLLTRRWNLLLSSSRDFACWKFSLQELSLNSESHFVQFCFLKAASFFFFPLSFLPELSSLRLMMSILLKSCETELPQECLTIVKFSLLIWLVTTNMYFLNCSESPCF